MSAPWAERGHLTAGGKRLEYACFGPPPCEALSVVLLHEGLGCLDLWRDFPRALAQKTGLGVFAFSRAGYGHSDKADLPRPLDYMTREACDVLPQVLEEIGAQSTILLGHSDGATIAAIHAGRVADARLRGLILMAPHFFTEPMGLAAIAKAKSAFEQGGLRQRMGKYHRDAEHTFRGWCDSWLHPDFKAWNVADALEGICVPVLAIQGAQDEYGTLAQIDEIEARCPAPLERMILDACRHAPFLDQRGAVLDAVSDYCMRQAAEAGA